MMRNYALPPGRRLGARSYKSARHDIIFTRNTLNTTQIRTRRELTCKKRTRNIFQRRLPSRRHQTEPSNWRPPFLVTDAFPATLRLWSIFSFGNSPGLQKAVWRRKNGRKEWGQSSLLTLLMRERAPANCRKISQDFSPAGVTSPCEARATPTDPTSVVPVSGR